MRVIFTTDTADSGVFYFDLFIPEQTDLLKFINNAINSTLLLKREQVISIDFGKDYINNIRKRRI